MTDPREETAELAAVKEQFITAEKRLRELAQGAVELTRASVLLKKARMGLSDGAEGLRDLSGRLSEYIDSLAGLTQQLHSATEAVQRSEADDRLAEIERRLGALQASVESHPIGEHSSRSADVAELAVALQRVDAVSEDLAQRVAEMESLALLPKVAEDSEQMVRAIEAAGLDTLAARLDSAVQRQLPAGAPAAGAAPDGATAEALERLDGSISQLSSITRTLRETPPDAARESFRAIEQKLDDLQNALTRSVRKPRVPGTDTSPDQIDLLPEVEDSLMALAQEMHVKEVAMVDMLAELRRSVGRDLDRREKALAASLQKESAAVQRGLDRVRTAVWILAAAAVVGLALMAFFS
jgi:DNA repair exonuclease SbcCD ATPase subunit